MNARTTSKKGSPILAAMGVRIVATDHQTTPNPKTFLPPTVSAHMPPAICFHYSYKPEEKVDESFNHRLSFFL